jgi:hypothetical protein
LYKFTQTPMEKWKIYIKHNSVILTAYDCKRRPEHGL